MNLILILQGMDMIFTRLIFLPALIILYFKFRPRRPWTIRTNVIKLRHWDARTFEVGHTKNVCPVFFL